MSRVCSHTCGTVKSVYVLVNAANPRRINTRNALNSAQTWRLCLGVYYLGWSIEYRMKSVRKSEPYCHVKRHGCFYAIFWWFCYRYWMGHLVDFNQTPVAHVITKGKTDKHNRSRLSTLVGAGRARPALTKTDHQSRKKLKTNRQTNLHLRKNTSCCQCFYLGFRTSLSKSLTSNSKQSVFTLSTGSWDSNMCSINHYL